MSQNDVLLKMEHISKSFPGVKALDDVQLEVKAGTVHALMGENGAGKSTLMKCLFGIYHKDEGHIYLNGEEVNFKDSKDALEHGVAMVHQELNQALRMGRRFIQKGRKRKCMRRRWKSSRISVLK